MITQKNMPWSIIKFFQLILKEMYGDQFREFLYWYWGLKG